MAPGPSPVKRKCNGASTLSDCFTRTRFIARQPVVDRNLAIYGHELLHRSGPRNVYSATNDTAASLQVLDTSGLCSNAAPLGHLGRAFVNFNRELLTSGTALRVLSNAIVIEILEDCEADQELLKICRQLHDAGYLLAADDVVSSRGREALLEDMDFIKVDVQATSCQVQEQIVRRYASQHTRIVAEKVETPGHFSQSRQMGYDLFQGNLLGPAVVVEVQSIVRREELSVGGCVAQDFPFLIKQQGLTLDRAYEVQRW